MRRLKSASQGLLRGRRPIMEAFTVQPDTSQGADADAARVRALAAYKDFLTLWKDANPDISILKEAKAGAREVAITVRTWASSGTEPDRCREIDRGNGW